jgi:hypothetical protein
MTNPIRFEPSMPMAMPVYEEVDLNFDSSWSEDNAGNVIRGSVRMNCSDEATRSAINLTLFEILRVPSRLTVDFLLKNQECEGLLEIFIQDSRYYNDLPPNVQSFIKAKDDEKS